MLLEVLLNAFLGGLVCFIATGLGATVILFKSEFSSLTLDSFFGFSIGIMLAAPFFSLLQPALELGGVIVVSFGFLIGASFMYFSDISIPHEHSTEKTLDGNRSNRLWKIITAITLHNIPEAHSGGHGKVAMFFMIVGFILMMILNVVL
jgi:ZIP family zinc transporter